ncbi:hypothetical protein ROHU_031006 [Labeo rohita]|uniref:Uncharacterized protein n=1 Tax=Labeo rohita TaxID=84645 RepID=A0A498LQH6_LABRO|nr:hypothetical protein ROHU_031006 [Labeo rohita]
MVFASSVWGKNTLPSGSRESASTAIFYRSKCFVRGSLFFKDERAAAPSLASWGSHVDLAEAQIDLESATSERSSCDDKTYEELLEVVTRAVDRLKLDWPQEQETLKRSKLDDRFLSGG